MVQATQQEKTLKALTPEEMTAFENNGFHLARGLFTQHDVDVIREAFMELNKNGPVEGISEIRRGSGGYSPSDPLSFYPRVMHPHLHPELAVGPLSKRYMLDPRFRPILHDLFGEEAVGAQTMFYFKPPGARGQSLHQDNYYLRVKPGTCMAAWVAIDDADMENGGMVVVPGSHKMDIACPEKSDARVSFTDDYVPIPDGLKEVPAIMKAGDVLFFNGSLIHGSTPNTSKNRFRRSFICHYLPLGSVELSGGYKDTVTFDDAPVKFAEATGGGPCGRPHEVLAIH